jgi:hypothetical protein
MTEEEKAAIRASYAGKRVSEMTEIERKVFDEGFQYGFGAQARTFQESQRQSRIKELSAKAFEVLNRLTWIKK